LADYVKNFTLPREGRFDKQGHLEVYSLPSGDGGGSFEIAGINDRYHPEMAAKLRDAAPETRATMAADYIAGYVAPTVSKLPKQLQGFAADMTFNRGAGGMTRYLQEALNTMGQELKVDGALGPKTLEALSKVSDNKKLMQAMSQAQQNHELRMAANNPDRQKFLKGLTNRINARLEYFGGQS
jgi:lysozyme family protein